MARVRKMSLYVVPENQEMLWNVINKNLFIQQYFTKFPPDVQHSWFQSIIRHFYEKNKSGNITVNDLHNINRETVAYMIENVRQRSLSMPAASTPTMLAPTISTPPHHPDNKQDVYAQEFQQRQQEYKQMIEKKQPEGIDFREKTADTAISNMSELIQQHSQQRESDIKMYSPPPPTPASKSSPDSVSNITLTVDPKPAPAHGPTTYDLSTYIEPLTKQITELSGEVQSQKQYITQLNETIRAMQDQIAQLYSTKVST